MVYLMFRNRTHQVVKVMGHDVKQFKSLEGFLESGPQFVLQSYIVLRGDKQGIEDFHSVDASENSRKQIFQHLQPYIRISSINCLIFLQNASPFFALRSCCRSYHWQKLDLTSTYPIQTRSENRPSSEKTCRGSGSRRCRFTLFALSSGKFCM